jgi:hypothetical protein
LMGCPHEWRVAFRLQVAGAATSYAVCRAARPGRVQIVLEDTWRGVAGVQQRFRVSERCIRKRRTMRTRRLTDRSAGEP